MKEDRISELPDCLLHHILSFTDATDAVKTCILSKRWRYLWTSLPSLTFNYRDSRVNVNFINQLLIRRNSVPIHSFYYASSFQVNASEVERWICYAINHQVQHLTIEVHCPKFPIQLSNCFCGCTSLITLKLDGYYFSLTLPKTLEFPSLKNLHLVRFRLDDFDASFFSSCPNLETLKLEDVWFEVIGSFSVCALNLRTFEFESLESDFDWNYEFVIVAPKLRKFKFDGYPPFFCSTKNLCSPDQIEIHLPSDLELLYSTDELKQRLALEVLQMLKAFHTAESITLFVNVLQTMMVRVNTIFTALNLHCFLVSLHRL
ncbi:F-box/LRR-repeat protein 25-like isoform X2 [Mercurialis annua]|uniref:F-box/LRR-repeat protein 25-like isoform X2 n=1 Tax=Mercurialis annua TaxID=3986 RepID=UPI00215DF9D1|nr:F-box/LRR-repeat protein 25-like isoform X2 [Mercurialis annua]